MFGALLAHLQEVLHKRQLVYCVRIMSVGCGTVALCHRATQKQTDEEAATVVAMKTYSET
jgi:hypothetical protein